MEFKHVDLGNKGSVKAIDDDIQYGEIVYSKAGPNKIIIEHTEVEAVAKNKGVGKKLVFEVVKYAREHDLKIMPLCPFAKAEFDKNEEYKDVMF